MSEPPVVTDSQQQYAPGRRRAEKSGFGCLKMLVVAVLFLGVLAALVWVYVVPQVEDLFSDPEDYPGPGHGEVSVKIDQGQTIRSMGEELEELDVVASAEAFVDAADANQRSTSIQAGTYLMRLEMSAEDAVALLVDPANVAQDMVTVPEGLRVADVVEVLAKNTDFGAKAFEKVIDKPAKLGLPSHADGVAEGYLFPATYPVTPDDTPTSIVQKMVDRWRQSAEDLDLEARAAELGYTPHEIMTVAALVEAEGRGDDMPKIARVIYNRLENPGTAGVAGFLQIDATVDYALDRPLTVELTQEERETTDSPYNTFVNTGLPPGPIGNPGEAAMAAALEPAAGDWYYYITVNLETGETKFAESFEEFQQYEAELR
ncbi:MAG TPA: endolytic transglycosylase MltG, partial [Nocardioides sp.]|nr:endolytic transglycosylase MltG [Nocardioides sp.]